MKNEPPKVSDKLLSSNKDKVQEAPCPICSKPFPLTKMEEHVNKCLDDSSAPKESPKVSIKEPPKSPREPLAEKTEACPICSKKFPVKELENHVNRCLDDGNNPGLKYRWKCNHKAPSKSEEVNPEDPFIKAQVSD